MASGKAHARSTQATIVVVCVVVGVALLPPNLIAFMFGLIVGHYATPDVRDQQKNRNHGEKMVRDHFGKLAGWLWSAWWEPFAMCIPHRSPWSHLPVFATAVAALWLYAVPLALCWWYDVSVPWVLVTWHVAGWAVQDAVHLRGDGGLRKGIRW